MKRRVMPSGPAHKAPRRRRFVKRVLLSVAIFFIVVLALLAGSMAFLVLPELDNPDDEKIPSPGAQGLQTPTPVVTQIPPRVNTGPYKAIDDLDVLPPRPWESFIPFSEFLQCLAVRLHLDWESKRELPFPDSANETVPFLVQPVSVEIADTKQFMCSLRAPIRHVTYVMSGRAPEMRVFLEAVNSFFSGWTSRVQVHYLPFNLGRARAVNTGLRDAISSFGYDEVPFIFVSTPLVRIPPETMTSLVTDINDFITYDKAAIEKLEKEVAAEAEANAKLPHPLLLRTGPEGVSVASEKGLLSTSALLPERIRQMPVEKQMEAFIDHYAFFYFNTGYGPGNHHSFFVSRLAVLVGGYLDENHFHEFFSDNDIRWRYRQLGFASHRVAFDKASVTFYDDDFLEYKDRNEDVQFVTGTLQNQAELEKNGVLARVLQPKARPTLSPDAKTYKRFHKEALGDGICLAYYMWKWGVPDIRNFQDEFAPRPVYDSVNRGRPAGARTMPVDAWVLDKQRESAYLTKLAARHVVEHAHLSFQTSLLEQLDFLRSPAQETSP